MQVTKREVTKEIIPRGGQITCKFCYFVLSDRFIETNQFVEFVTTSSHLPSTHSSGAYLPLPAPYPKFKVASQNQKSFLSQYLLSSFNPQAL